MNAELLTSLVQALQITVATSLVFLGGLSSCLSLWVLPLTALLPPRLAVDQFNQTVTWGAHYLQPSSRTLAVLLLATAILTACLSDLAHAQAWKYWATALAILVPVAPYEVYMIFPINDKVRDIGVRVDRQGKDESGEKEAKRELRVLFKKWQFRNFGRVVMPLLAGVVGWLGVVDRQDRHVL